MAEFVQVMPQFMRLCDSYKHCDDCPIRQAGFNCDCDHQGYSKTGAAEIEHIIMSWAAEHPEPVYPTWKEWLEEQRVVVHFDSVNEKGKKVKWELTNKSNCPIPADIAEKLELKPQK